MTHYETLMSLIGYCIIANQLWYINTAGLAITLNESQKSSAPPFIPPQWLKLFWVGVSGASYQPPTHHSTRHQHPIQFEHLNCSTLHVTM